MADDGGSETLRKRRSQLLFEEHRHEQQWCPGLQRGRNELTTASAFANNANGQNVGTLGRLQAGPGPLQTRANFDVNYQPLEQLAASTPRQVVVQDGDTLRSIAARIYGDEALWYLIADENGEIDPDGELAVGRLLRVPSQIRSLSNSSESFKPFSVEQVIGDVTPTQAAPPPPAKNGCGVLGMIIVMVVVIIVSIYAGPAGQAVGQAFANATASATYAAGASMATVYTATSAAYAVGYAVGVGAVAGAASALGQGLAVAVGAQEKFSWEAVAASALTAGLMQGLGINAMFGDNASFAQMMVKGAVGSAVNQGVNIALGLQEKFSWRELAISSVSSATAGEIAEYANGGVNQAVVGTFTSVAVRRAMGGRVEVDAVLADVFANVIGNSVVDSINKNDANKNAEITLEVVDGQPGSARLAETPESGAPIAGEDWWEVGPPVGTVDYTEALEHLEGHRVFGDESPFAKATNRLIDRSATLLSYAESIANARFGGEGDITGNILLELAIEGDESAAWLLDSAGVDASLLQGLDPLTQNYRVAYGLWEAGRAGFDIVTSTPRAANSNGVNKDFNTGAYRALQLLAKDFEGMGSLGLIAAGGEAIPWVGGPLIGTANLGWIEREKTAVDYLARTRLVDSSVVWGVRESLSRDEFSSGLSRFTPLGGKIGTAIDIISTAPEILLDLIPEAHGASPRLSGGRISGGRAAVKSLDDLIVEARNGKEYHNYVSGKHFDEGLQVRGKGIETDILKERYKSTLDPKYYRTLDHLGKGLGASIKSLDLSKASYATPQKLEAALNRYINKLKDFSGYRGTMYKGGTAVLRDSGFPGAMRQKELVVALGGTAKPAQLDVLAALQKTHNSRNFKLIFYGTK